MRFKTASLLICLALWTGLVDAQAPVQAAPPAQGQARAPLQPAQDEAASGGARETPAWRNTAGYSFPALADTVARMQHVAQAMQLRDYCANRRLSDDFVRERLQRFSLLTGREEDCTTLLDY